MGRTTNPTPEAAEIQELDSAKVDALQNTGALLASVANEEHALVNQLLGQAQMADAFAKFSKTVLTSKLAYVKENKLYKALGGQKNQDGLELTGTWQEFCNMLGFTPEHANEAINNLKAFGEEALESMSRMGIGYREMRQFRKLPDDEKTALIEVAKTGDKEAFVELAEEIITKSVKEKEALQQNLNSTMADYEAQGDILQKKSQELDATKVELARAQRRIKEATPDEAEKQLKIEISGVSVEIQSLFKTRLDAALATLEQHSTETGSDQRLYMASLVKQIEMELLSIRDKYNLPADLDAADTDWMSADALANAEAAISQLQQEH